jgi:mono/diheme cytochrome c family protein
MIKSVIRPVSFIAIALLSAQSALAAGGLLMPDFDATRGRALFAAKGCVVCHSINGIGGEDAPALDYDPSTGPMDPFEFAAKMWRGAEPMIYMQQDELGNQIELDGAELAAIIAFAHDADEQAAFSESDIPENILDLMHEGSDEHMDDEADGDHDEVVDAAEDHG